MQVACSPLHHLVVRSGGLSTGAKVLVGRCCIFLFLLLCSTPYLVHITDEAICFLCRHTEKLYLPTDRDNNSPITVITMNLRLMTGPEKYTTSYAQTRATLSYSTPRSAELVSCDWLDYNCLCACVLVS